MRSLSGAKSLLGRVGFGVIFGSGLFGLGALCAYLLDVYGVSKTTVLWDDAVIAVLAGLLVFAYEQRQHQILTQRMRVIAAMNHHVRNALQVISYAPYTAGQAEQVRVIQEAVERIQWALSEVLPGEGEIVLEPPKAVRRQP